MIFRNLYKYSLEIIGHLFFFERIVTVYLQTIFADFNENKISLVFFFPVFSSWLIHSCTQIMADQQNDEEESLFNAKAAASALCCNLELDLSANASEVSRLTRMMRAVIGGSDWCNQDDIRRRQVVDHLIVNRDVIQRTVNVLKSSEKARF